jgi:carboxylesterase
MRPLAEAIAAAGHTVEMPLLPGHGTSIEDLIPTRWSDWLAAAEAAYTGLAGRTDRVAVVGLSMGGTLATRLAVDHPETAALVVINPAVEPGGDALLEMGRQMLAEGTEVLPGIGSDIARGGDELGYDGTPIAAVMSLVEATEELAPRIPGIHCPTLLFTSVQDHVVATTASDFLAAQVGGPVERVMLERSYHVATLDYDAPEIEARTVEFLAKTFSA